MKIFLKLSAIILSIVLMSCSKNSSDIQSTSTIGGNITYTVEGTTTKIEDEVSTVILENNTKIGYIANTDLSTYVGDSSGKLFTVGTPVTNIAISIKINGVQWVYKGSTNTMTITSYDGTTVKGTFTGKVGNNSSGSYIYKNITGSFETNNITKV
jgi:hypothetical protein